MKRFSKKITSFASFLLELLVYTGFVLAYFLIVLHFLGGWIKHVFNSDKFHYALLAVVLISVQGWSWRG